MWSAQKTVVQQGSSTTYEGDSGTYTLSLGAAVTIDGQEMYTVHISGEPGGSLGGTAVHFAPRHAFLGTDGERLLGSTQGTALETVFDLSGQAWQGGGWFAEWGASSDLAASPGHVSNDYVDVDSLMVRFSNSAGGCEYFPGFGVICDDEDLDIEVAEHAKEGIGPLGYDLRRYVSFNGGGFFSSYLTVHSVGLVDTSLVAPDGWTPPDRAWTLAAALPVPRSHFAAAALDGKIYVMGGTTPSGSTDRMDIYDSATDTWSAGPDLVGGTRSGCAAEAMDGKIYLFGGSGSGSTESRRRIHCFDPGPGTWTVLSASSPSMGSPESAVLPQLNQGLVAFFQGSYDNGEVRFYEPASDSWYSQSCGSLNRQSIGMTAADGTLIFLGGQKRDLWDPWNQYPELDEVRTWSASGCWGYADDLPNKRKNVVTVHLDGYVYAIGGDRNHLEVADVLRMNSATLGPWETIEPMLTPRAGHAAIALDGKLYVLGGRDAGNEILGSVAILDPSAL